MIPHATFIFSLIFLSVYSFDIFLQFIYFLFSSLGPIAVLSLFIVVKSHPVALLWRSSESSSLAGSLRIVQVSRDWSRLCRVNTWHSHYHRHSGLLLFFAVMEVEIENKQWRVSWVSCEENGWQETHCELVCWVVWWEDKSCVCNDKRYDIN